MVIRAEGSGDVDAIEETLCATNTSFRRRILAWADERLCSLHTKSVDSDSGSYRLSRTFRNEACWRSRSAA